MDGLDKLIKGLLAERPDENQYAVPDSLEEKRKLLRALMNVRPPWPIDTKLLALQDEELARQREEKGVVGLDEIPPSPEYPRLRVWQGDITRLAVDAIVNAANSRMLGCFVPLHNCIDNAIHSQAGMQLREECAEIMSGQGGEEETGHAKITSAYNLPSRFVIHTVGPIVQGHAPTEKDAALLAECYRNCLKTAENNSIASIAFSCISTGVFRFPQKPAARIAVEAVVGYFKAKPGSVIETVVFDVFTDTDLEIYRRLLGYQ